MSGALQVPAATLLEILELLNEAHLNRYSNYSTEAAHLELEARGLLEQLLDGAAAGASAAAT